MDMAIVLIISAIILMSLVLLVLFIVAFLNGRQKARHRDHTDCMRTIKNALSRLSPIHLEKNEPSELIKELFPEIFVLKHTGYTYLDISDALIAHGINISKFQLANHYSRLMDVKLHSVRSALGDIKPPSGNQTDSQ